MNNKYRKAFAAFRQRCLDNTKLPTVTILFITRKHSETGAQPGICYTGDKRGDLGSGVQGQSPGGGLGRSPQKPETKLMLISSYDGGHAPMSAHLATPLLRELKPPQKIFMFYSWSYVGIAMVN